MAFDKIAWQREQRQLFVVKHGYSSKAHYDTGGLREQVLERDGRRCIKCGMTDVEHKAKWKRPITVDHKSRNRKENTLANLQTLCLSCHGNKDLIPRLRVQRIPEHKIEIISRRLNGESYQRIADDLGFSIAGIFKWVKRWEAI